MQYLPVLMLVIVAAGLCAFMLIASSVLGKRGARPAIKDAPYECGALPFGGSNTRYTVKFYTVAMLFVLFDIEVVFLYPWAVVYKDMLKTDANLILGAMLSFLTVLLVGYLYALKKGALNWNKR